MESVENHNLLSNDSNISIQLDLTVLNVSANIAPDEEDMICDFSNINVSQVSFSSCNVPICTLGSL